MNESRMLYIIADSLLTSSQLEVEECRTHRGEHARDSWIACMVTARVLGRLASALTEVKRELEKENAPSEKTLAQFQFPTLVSVGGGDPAPDQPALQHGEGSDPSAA